MSWGDEDHREPELFLQLSDLQHQRPLSDHIQRRSWLVQTTSWGVNSSAIAIIARWRMPPLS